VSISATATEDLFAIGAGPQVKAVDDYSKYPPSAPRTKLSGYTPNAEAIAGYRPDLVVTAGDANRVVASLRKLGIAVLLHPPAADLDEAYAQLEALGEATGHSDRARTPRPATAGRRCRSTTSWTAPITRPRRRPSLAASTGRSACATSPTRRRRAGRTRSCRASTWSGRTRS
jgi:ABC-type hemin transport system substrate-binding protein